VKFRKILIKTIIGVIVAVVMIWSLFPLLYLSIISFAGLGALPTTLQLPKRLTLDNWQQVLYGEAAIWPYMLNSLIIAAVTIAITLLIALPAAYSFSRFRTRTNRTIFVLLLFFRMVPYISLIIPIFFLMKRYGLLGARLGVSLSHLVYTVPISVWLMKGYFDMLPTEMEEAGLIDGANRFQAFWRISVPLSAPGMAVTAMFTFLLSYTEYLFALIITRQPTFTVSVRLTFYMAIHETLWRPMACASIVSMIPMIVVFLFLQKHLVRGFTLGAVK